MRIKILSILLTIFFISCNKIQLVKSDIKYNDLPNQIKENIFNDQFVDLNNPNKYKVEYRKTFLPWINETRIIRLTDNKSYEIDFDKEYCSSTLIILDDFLFTTNNYNIYEQDIIKYAFSKYLIKKDQHTQFLL